MQALDNAKVLLLEAEKLALAAENTTLKAKVAKLEKKIKKIRKIRNALHRAASSMPLSPSEFAGMDDDEYYRCLKL
jgi:uncharacterized protein YlxW (UPF0749 family)